MKNQHYQKIRIKVERELESVDKSGTPSINRLLPVQYVSGLIDVVGVNDLFKSY